jgi:hypothetical protein
LRGRAGLGLIVHLFSYRDAARFWQISDPKLAVLVHSVVGGTPAYRQELVREDTPADLADFDAWVTRTVLNPQTPLFREARHLLAQETEIRDPSLYHSVLAPGRPRPTPPMTPASMATRSRSISRSVSWLAGRRGGEPQRVEEVSAPRLAGR